ncbi:hypothetical protein QC334_16760 [Streptomyces sp. DH18]|uniref:hypothetical protein n=1 Tax=unclassified Streptomyces TaxID=2593676 RepID=UPI001E2AB5BE|nr:MULTISPECIES: hypothetical protein [unclassified Streptomyces]MDG9684359.1 hypothetical protein [Streptomyces sp. DH18]
MNTMSVDATSVRPTATVADAREGARAFLEALPEPVLAAGAADAVILIVSELVTNAPCHGGGTYTPSA